jgi:hypothetical protein
MRLLAWYCCGCAQYCLSISQFAYKERSLDLSFETLGQQIGEIAYCERPPPPTTGCKAGVTAVSVITLSSEDALVFCGSQLGHKVILLLSKLRNAGFLHHCIG